MKISLKFISLVTGFYLIAVTGAHAEYYLVSSGTTSACNNTCATPCSPCATYRCNTCVTTCYFTEKRLYHDSWRDHKNRRSHYTIDAVETNCPGLYGVSQSYGTHRDYVTMQYYTVRPRHPHYVSTANDPYNPDMTTADDEVMVDSDMNNQY